MLELKAVLAGALPDSVLDTYEQERAPNVEWLTQVSAFTGRMVKQELSAEELAAVMPQPGAPPPPSPLLAPADDRGGVADGCGGRLRAWSGG